MARRNVAIWRLERRPTLPEVLVTRAFAKRAPTALVQLLRTPYITLSRQLPADARALLVWLLLEAHHVRRSDGPPVLLRLSATAIADELGLPRRRLTRLLTTLEAADAISWHPGSGGRDGRLEVVAYPRLVRDGRRELDGNFVQLLVEPLENERHRLGFDTWATLVGLLMAVPWAGQRLQASGGHLAELLGVSWGILRRHGKELAALGLIQWSAGTRSRSEAAVEVTAYRGLVKVVVAELGCERKARSLLLDRAEPASGSREGPGLLPPLDKERLTETPCLPSPVSYVGVQAPTSEGRQVEQPATEPDVGLRLVLELASALQSRGGTHDLADRHNRPGLRALARRLSELVAGGWETDALRDELLEGLRGARSVLAVVLSRARELPTNPGVASATADEQAEAEAGEQRERRERRLEAARAHTRNLLTIEGVDISDVLAGLERYRQEADAWEAAVGELVRLRPGASALLGDWSVAS